MIHPKSTSPEMLQNFLAKSLLDARSYSIDTPNIKVKLDQNESPVDWPADFKNRVFERARKYSWNRYPSPFADDVVQLTAENLGITPESLLLGPGSNYLIALVMSTIGFRQKGDLVIARPSFALYEAHALYASLPYRTWDLNEQLEYDLSKLDGLKEHSLVVFASPNNPVGNVLKKKELQSLLQKNPTSVFVADEAYFEFAHENYLDLLADYSNLVIIRTFSKAMGAAGIRQGYVAASPQWIHELKKPRVPYLINHFGIAAMLEVLNSKDMQDFFANTVKQAVSERNRIYKELTSFAPDRKILVKNSEANSVLVRWSSDEAMQKAYQGLIDNGVLVRNVSKGPGLARCLRISVGLPAENDAFLTAAKKVF